MGPFYLVLCASGGATCAIAGAHLTSSVKLDLFGCTLDIADSMSVAWLAGEWS